jgi:hypothetical protein
MKTVECRYSAAGGGLRYGDGGFERTRVAQSVRTAIHFDLLFLDLNHFVECEKGWPERRILWRHSAKRLNARPKRVCAKA